MQLVNRSSFEIILLGGAGTYDCKIYSQWQNFTNDNFFYKNAIVSFTDGNRTTPNSGSCSGSYSAGNISYNASTGIVTCTNPSASGNGDGTKRWWNMSSTAQFYLIT